MKRPTDSSVITLPYGATSSPYSPTNPHAGVDYRAPLGSDIYAPHAGKVTVSGSMGSCGLAVEIDGGKFRSRLCHNSKTLVSVGSQVAEGQKVALSGATGTASGAHCHWILWDNGVRVDGSKYLSGDKVMDRVAVQYGYRLGWNREPTETEYNYWVGKETGPFLRAIYDSNHEFRFGAVNYKDTFAKLQALEKDKVELKSGNYYVK